MQLYKTSERTWKPFGASGCGGFYFIVATDEEYQPGCLMLLSVPAPVFELHSDCTKLGSSVASVAILIWGWK